AGRGDKRAVRPVGLVEVWADDSPDSRLLPDAPGRGDTRLLDKVFPETAGLVRLPAAPLSRAGARGAARLVHQLFWIAPSAEPFALLRGPCLAAPRVGDGLGAATDPSVDGPARRLRPGCPPRVDELPLRADVPGDRAGSRGARSDRDPAASGLGRGAVAHGAPSAQAGGDLRGGRHVAAGARGLRPAGRSAPRLADPASGGEESGEQSGGRSLVPQGGGPARIRPVQAERRRRATRALSSGRSNGVGREASVGKTDPGAWCDQRGPRQLAGASLWSRASREESP